MTGGDILYYPKFNSFKHAEKLYFDLFRLLSRQYGTQVTIKARCTTGFSVVEYFGGFGHVESTQFTLSSMNSDQSFGFTLRNDKKLQENDVVHVQIAMLYTSMYQENRLRIFNVSFKVIDNLNKYFKSCTVESYVNYFLKQKLSKIDVKGPKLIREEILNELVDIMYNYRVNCAPNSQPS